EGGGGGAGLVGELVGGHRVHRGLDLALWHAGVEDEDVGSEVRLGRRGPVLGRRRGDCHGRRRHREGAEGEGGCDEQLPSREEPPHGHVVISSFLLHALPQPQLSRTTSRTGSTASGSPPPALTLEQRTSKAVAPSSRIGWRTVVRGGCRWRATEPSSNPVTATSPGTAIPRRARACSERVATAPAATPPPPARSTRSPDHLSK